MSLFEDLGLDCDNPSKIPMLLYLEEFFSLGEIKDVISHSDHQGRSVLLLEGIHIYRKGLTSSFPAAKLFSPIHFPYLSIYFPMQKNGQVPCSRLAYFKAFFSPSIFNFYPFIFQCDDMVKPCVFWYSI